MLKYVAVRSGAHEEHLTGEETMILLNPEDYLCDETGICQVLGSFDTLDEAVAEANAYGASTISAAPFGFYVEVVSVRCDEYDDDGDYIQGDTQWISPLPSQFTAKNGLIFSQCEWNRSYYNLVESDDAQ